MIIVEWYATFSFQGNAMPSSGGHHLVISIMTALLTSFAPVTAINGDLSCVISFLTIADVGTQLQKIGDDLIGAHSKHLLLSATVKLLVWCLRTLNCAKQWCECKGNMFKKGKNQNF